MTNLFQILLRVYNLRRGQQTIQEVADCCGQAHQFRTLQNGYVCTILFYDT